MQPAVVEILMTVKRYVRNGRKFARNIFVSLSGKSINERSLKKDVQHILIVYLVRMYYRYSSIIIN